MALSGPALAQVAPTVALAATSASTYTSAGAVTITVIRSGPASAPIVVTYSTSDGSAHSGTDYVATSGTLTWAAGDASPRVFSVPILASGAGNTAFSALLLSASGANFGAPLSETVGIMPTPAAVPSSAQPTVAFSSAAYTSAAMASAATLTILRSGNASTAITLSYATVDGTAVAGTNYTATSGVVTWPSGDSSPRSISIPLLGAPTAGTFSVEIISALGANFGTPLVATVSLTPPSATALSIRVQGNQFVDGNGRQVQLRGANISGLEGLFNHSLSAGRAADTQSYWRGANLAPYPFWNDLLAWRINAVRIPLNEAAWLRSYTVVDLNGNVQQPDLPGGYQAAVLQSVADATAAGLYVILDLHWAAPGDLAPEYQDALPDIDHSVAFWTSIAQAFGSNPAVIFDLFNEPYESSAPSSAGNWQIWRDGGLQSVWSIYDVVTLNYPWNSAGSQTLLNAVRASGASNVCLIGGLSGASDLSQWLSFAPLDPIKQIAASWHDYSGPGGQGANAAAILAAGIPVVIGETGDASADGTTSAPVISAVTEWADQNGASVLAWAWDHWTHADGTAGSANILIKDGVGTPTDGEGAAFQAWTLNHP